MKHAKTMENVNFNAVPNKTMKIMALIINGLRVILLHRVTANGYCPYNCVVIQTTK